MTMAQEKFDALVKQLEDYAQRQPANYKLRLGLLAVLGYKALRQTAGGSIYCC